MSIKQIFGKTNYELFAYRLVTDCDRVTMIVDNENISNLNIICQHVIVD